MGGAQPKYPNWAWESTVHIAAATAVCAQENAPERNVGRPNVEKAPTVRCKRRKPQRIRVARISPLEIAPVFRASPSVSYLSARNELS